MRKHVSVCKDLNVTNKPIATKSVKFKHLKNNDLSIRKDYSLTLTVLVECPGSRDQR